MIISVYDYSMLIRPIFFRSKKHIKHYFLVDFLSQDAKPTLTHEKIEISGYFYFCKKIKTSFIFFQHKETLYLIKKNDLKSYLYNLSEWEFSVEKNMMITLKSFNISHTTYYKTNYMDIFFCNTESMENPDFFEWIYMNLQDFKRNGITFPAPHPKSLL